MTEKESLLDKRFSSDKEAITHVEPLVMDLKDRLGIEEERFYDFLVCVTEAANNAIMHGNKYDEKKSFGINVSKEGGSLVCRIEDEGGGFDPTAIPDPTEAGELLKDHGRGVFIIRKLADRVDFDFSGKGSKITMYFNLADRE